MKIITGIATLMLVPLWLPFHLSGDSAKPVSSVQGRSIPAMYNRQYSFLDTGEVQSLLQMREEEKMARDVYIRLSEKWGSRVFQNISSAEQRHMQAVYFLLDKYGIADPVKSDSVGVFTDPRFAVLYRDFVKKGNVSLLAAFEAGAAIEDLDIQDLEKILTITSNEDIKRVYGNLQIGSRNHLRAFCRNIAWEGGQPVVCDWFVRDQ